MDATVHNVVALTHTGALPHSAGLGWGYFFFNFKGHIKTLAQASVLLSSCSTHTSSYLENKFLFCLLARSGVCSAEYMGMNMSTGYGHLYWLVIWRQLYRSSGFPRVLIGFSHGGLPFWQPKACEDKSGRESLKPRTTEMSTDKTHGLPDTWYL